MKNLIEIIEEAMLTDDEPINKKSRRLLTIFNQADDYDKDVLDMAFIALCGFSLRTLVSRSKTQDLTEDPHPYPYPNYKSNKQPKWIGVHIQGLNTDVKVCIGLNVDDEEDASPHEVSWRMDLDHDWIYDNVDIVVADGEDAMVFDKNNKLIIKED